MICLVERNMDKELNCDISGSFQCPTPSELNQCFFAHENFSVSALSLEEPSTSIVAPIEVVSLFSETKKGKPLALGSGTRTPTLVEGIGKSSTPVLHLQKPTSSLDLSYYADFTASQPPWELSFIKPEVNNAKPILESSVFEPILE